MFTTFFINIKDPPIKKRTILAPGNSAGATIPKVLLEKYNSHEGDSVFQLEAENGILLSPYDPGFETSMEFTRKNLNSIEMLIEFMES